MTEPADHHNATRRPRIFDSLNSEQMLFGLVFVVALLWALASLSWPFGWDQGILAVIGDIIHSGGMPYRDGWDMKGPLAYYVFAFAQLMFGHHAWAIRVVDLALLTATVWQLNRTVAFLANAVAGRWAALLFVLWYASGSYWHTAQPDGWAAMLATIALAPVLRSPRAPSLLLVFLAGVLIGCTALLKPPYAAFLAVPALCICMRRGATVPGMAGDLTILAAGALGPVLLMAGWFWRAGALGDLLQVHLNYAIRVYSGVTSPSVATRLEGVAEHLVSGTVIATLLPAMAIGAHSIWRRERALAAGLVSWALVTTGVVVLQNRFFTYQWLPTLPPFAILGAVGLADALRDGNGTALVQRRFVLVTLFVVVGHALAHPLLEIGHWAAYAARLEPADRYYDHFGIPGNERRAAAYIRAHSLKSDGVAIYGWNASILFMSERTSPTRFVFSLPLLAGEGAPIRNAYRSEFMTALQRVPPTYVVVGPQSEMLLGRRFALSDFPEFEQFLSMRYARERAFGELELYHLR